MQRILAIIRKEFIHISRDFRTLIIVIVLPVVMLFLYGFAINLDLKDIRLVTLDAGALKEDLMRHGIDPGAHSFEHVGHSINQRIDQTDECVDRRRA